MRVLVSDTSVLIDLERGDLLESAFALPFEFAVPDLLYKRELKDYNGPKLRKLGLRVEELDGDGIERALDYREQAPPLSLPDAFALSLAKTNGCTLLSGDKALRNLAESERVACHGVLWVLEEMHTRGACEAKLLHTGLTTIQNHPRCRLPKREMTRLLAAFAAALEE